jgi:hypothetical protein
MNFLTKIPESTRARLYQIALAVVVLAGLYGLINETVAVGWVALVTAVFGGSMAVANTSTKPWQPDDRGESTLVTILVVLLIVVIAIWLLGVYR